MTTETDREYVARWQTPSGRWWVELYREIINGRVSFHYLGTDSCGSLGYVTSLEAIASMESLIAKGFFQPGSRPVQRVNIEGRRI